jgi:dTDP-4-dehydrorhamnose 3,5-epimerase
MKPERHDDSRGFLSEVYSRKALISSGIDMEFVQDNHSLSTTVGTVRGLHYQIAPMAQTKLVRVVRGAIFDVAVDLRRHSLTFGHHVAVVISAKEWNQIFVPIGFAHGFCTLAPDTEVLYRASDYYSPAHERGLLWNDPALAIKWPSVAANPTLSERDCAHPRLSDVADLF